MKNMNTNTNTNISRHQGRTACHHSLLDPISTLQGQITMRLEPDNGNETPLAVMHKQPRYLLAGLLAIGTFATAAATATAAAQAQQSISRADSRPTVDAPAQYFTGKARITPQFGASAQAPITGGYVTFDAGARSNWHTHPNGQRLLITAGSGRTQQWGGPVVELHAGDVVWCPPGVKHWHGAAPTENMTHLALTGSVADRNVVWMEAVTDAEYGK
jgi:quercetin dioxygenase-like cupin family protein